MKQIYALEPFYGGSHKRFLDELRVHVDLPIQLLTMSPHHWKWRMHGSAVYFADVIREQALEPGMVIASDFLHLSALRGLVPRPADWTWIYYFHENQLTYPFREKQDRDLTFAHMNIQSALAADWNYFNSQYHRNDFLEAIPEFYQQFTDHKPQNIPQRLRSKSSVLPPGLDLRRYDAISYEQPSEQPGILLWNHRWEHDKNPNLFFRVLFQLQEDGIPFRLIVCGENFEEYPEIFDTAHQKLADQIIHWGYAKSSEEYGRLLLDADILVSTAHHDFFGISVLEAMYCRCYPVLPKRLVYPEYIPSGRKKKNLYTSERDLYRKLHFALTRIDQTREIQFRGVAEVFDWSQVGPQWESELRKWERD